MKRPICRCAICSTMTYAGQPLADRPWFDHDGYLDQIEIAHLSCALEFEMKRADNGAEPYGWCFNEPEEGKDWSGVWAWFEENREIFVEQWRKKKVDLDARKWKSQEMEGELETIA